MQNISPIKQRILQYADTLNISMRNFYENTGISRGTLESKTGITEETLAKFIAKYQNVNIKWLILGDGDMIITNRPADSGEICHGCIEKDKTIKSLNFTIELLQDKISDLKQKKLYMQSEDITSIAAEPVAELAKKQGGRR